MKKLFFVAALLVAAGEKSLAQGVRLDDSIITETNFETNVLSVAKNVTVITAEEIQEKGAKTVADALKGVPNLKTSTLSGSDSKFDLRGQGEAAFSNTIVLLDGIPLNSIDLSGYKTSQIPIENIERIEIIPSGGSVLYGDGAIGGIINIISKAPLDIENYGSVGLEYGSNNFLKSNLNFGTKLTDKTLLDLNYSSKNFDTFRDDSKDNSDSIDIKVRQLIEDGYVELKYSHSKNDFKAQGSIMGKEEADSDPTQPGGWIVEGVNKYDTFNLNFSKKLTDKFEFLLNTERKEQDYKEEGWAYTTTTTYIKPQIKYNYFKNSYLILGGDYSDGTTKISKSWSGPGKITKDSRGVFVIDKFQIGNMELQQGYRNQKIDYDIKGNSKKFNEDALDFSANYLIGDTSSVYISYNTAFRTPNTDELNFWDGEYNPQTAKTIEIGSKNSFGNSFVSAAIFKTDTENEIAYAKIDGSGSFNRNLDGKSERIGAELAAEHYFENLTLRGSIGYLKHEMKDGTYEGKEIPGVPKINSSITASYRFDEKFILNGTANYYGSSYYYTDFRNEGKKLDSYLTVDTNLRYIHNEGLTLYVGINNLFNKTYYSWAGHGDTSISDKRSFYPAPGRNYYAGFKYKF